ncbi:hypothetical protein [Pseudomonas aeruginosa]|uniref:hypothetical protein n=1 Tax=Pseudomonas aeruginosa TaxID=287 RepID=UPI0011523482|nr:hypothetical protein [Pseudomonas aeruginosa]TQH48082.1 hypothetical protein FLI59_32665 [Pseudomonas aeruginosa]
MSLVNVVKWLGVGTVAATKDTNTHEAMIHLPLHSPTADGRTLAKTEQKEETSQNKEGEMITSKTLVSNTVPAVWRSIGNGNRLTSPDVREGAKVWVFQITGQNQYYWDIFGDNTDRFRLETVLWGWGANPGLAQDVPFNPDNFYTARVSTHDGLVGLRTSQSNGERSGFDIQVNAKEGRIDIRGTDGSIFSFDDYKHQFTYTNKEGSTIAVNKEKMAFYTKDSISFHAEKEINVLTKTFNLQSDTINMKANLANIAIGQTNWEGNITHTGNTEQKGNYTQEGDYTQNGNTTRTGNSVSTGLVIGQTDVRTVRVSLNLHIHGGVDPGNGTTSPPVA